MTVHDPRTVCVLGAQWGDEGKGKIVDVLCENADVVVRFQGGANAGHTVIIGGTRHVLHLLPSGILRPGVRAVLGCGMVIDPATLLDEMASFNAAGIDTKGRVVISERAHVVMPYHRWIDGARERRAGEDKIGTTLRGIGPCYEDKAARRGIRMAELIDPDVLRAWLERVLPEKNVLLAYGYGEKPLSLEDIWRTYAAYGAKLRPAVANVVDMLADMAHAGRRILFEGAQGAMLDLDLGTYPFVTSSSTCLGAIGTGCGFPPRRLDVVLGVVKAYATRVGSGPFPSEAPPETADVLREAGGEYGATTGRPRRCGWLDMVALKRALWTGDIDRIVLTKLDVLDAMPEIKVAVAYRHDGKTSGSFPATFPARPIDMEWRTFPGWRTPISACRRFADLPRACRDYVNWIAAETGRPIDMLSVGPDREHIIRMERPEHT